MTPEGKVVFWRLRVKVMRLLTFMLLAAMLAGCKGVLLQRPFSNDEWFVERWDNPPKSPG